MTKNTILLAQGGAFANFIINSPLEQFEVTSLLGLNIPLLGYFNFSLTNLGLYSIVVLFLIVISTFWLIALSMSLKYYLYLQHCMNMVFYSIY